MLKFLIKNIAEKKFRTFLVVLSISITSALFFSSIAISDTLLKMNTDKLMQISGTSDIKIQPKQSASVSQFIKLNDARRFSGMMKYAVGVIEGSALYAPGKYESYYMQVLGIDPNDLEMMNPVSFYGKPGLGTFEGNKIVISKNTADKYNLKEGSTIALEAGGSKRNYTIAAIAVNKGLFLDESHGIIILMPKATLGRIYGADDRVNTIYIKLKDMANKQELMDDLAKVYKDCDVKEVVNQMDLDETVSRVSTPFKLVILLVILMSVFIIYTSFKVISLERLPVIGTFRSIGATKLRTNLLLILETVIMGIVGGIAGCFLGVLALYFMTASFTAEFSNVVDINVGLNMFNFIITFAFAVVLSVVSALIPILGVIRIPVKDIILRTTSKVTNNKIWVTVTAIVMLIASIIVPRFIDGFILTMIVVNTCMTFAMVGVILLIPSITKIITDLLGKLYSLFFGNEGMLAAKNVYGNKSLINNITLLTIGISGIILIYTINLSLAQQIVKTYKEINNYDILMSYRQASKSFLNKLSKFDGIKDTDATYVLSSVKAEEKDGFYIGQLVGISGEKYFQFYNCNIPKDSMEAINELDSDRNIILTDVFQNNFGFKKGDTVTLDINDKKKTYKVTGFINTLLANGNIAFISEKYMRLDADMKYYSSICIKTTKNAAEVKESIKRKYLKDVLSIDTLGEMIESNQKDASSTFAVLESFSQIAMLIGIVGIVNNLVVSFIERKRYLAVFCSVGMSRRQLKKMLVIEAATIGIIGTLFGFIACIALLQIIPFLLKPIVGEIEMVYTPSLFGAAALFTVLMMIITSVIPAMKSSKLSIIEAIKYE